MSTNNEKKLWVPRMYAFLEARGGSAPKSRVVEEGMKYVPSGAAFRAGHRKRTLDSRWRNFGVERDLRSKDALSLVRAGANKLVCDSLYYERKAGRLLPAIGERLFGADGTELLQIPGTSTPKNPQGTTS